ncbi:MAG: penicillin acylase family protein, partial [Myxococcales bacterium]
EKRIPAGARAAIAAEALTMASNSWVVGGDRSASGKPIVANDPHMAHLLPSMVYLQHLRAPGLDVIGATVAGVPFVLMGHNGRVAWGTTSTVADATDLYIERLNPANPDEYETPEGFRPFAKDEVVIRVRQGGRQREERRTLRRTIHGPLLNDMYPGLFPAGSPPVALRWETGSLAGGILALGRANRAPDVAALRAELSKIATPVASWSAADVNGRIANFATGRVPIRRHHLGTFPVPGWRAEYEWAGTIPADAMPGGEADGGRFVHANNLYFPLGCGGDYLQADSAPSYRHDRILALLDAEPRHTVETMRVVQNDVLLLRAARLTPMLTADLDGAATTDEERKALEILRGWDFVARPESPAAAIFFVTYREATLSALGDEAEPRVVEYILANRYSTAVADLWFDDPNHVAWDRRDTPVVETRREILRAAFVRAVAMLAGKQGKDPAAWQWGKLHELTIAHAFGAKKAVGKKFNLPRTGVGGGLDSVWKTHFDIANSKEPFRAIAGPVYRMVVDLADPAHGWWIIDGGVSGWPLSPHYGDQFALWARGELAPMPFDWTEIAAAAEATVTLRPPE